MNFFLEITKNMVLHFLSCTQQPLINDHCHLRTVKDLLTSVFRLIFLVLLSITLSSPPGRQCRQLFTPDQGHIHLQLLWRFQAIPLRPAVHLTGR